MSYEQKGVVWTPLQATIVDRSRWIPGPWDLEPDMAVSDGEIPIIARRNVQGVWQGWMWTPASSPLGRAMTYLAADLKGRSATPRWTLTLDVSPFGQGLSPWPELPPALAALVVDPADGLWLGVFTAKVGTPIPWIHRGEAVDGFLLADIGRAAEHAVDLYSGGNGESVDVLWPGGR